MGEKEKECPKCGKKMIRVYIGIGGFPGHPHIHRGPLLGYRCDNCGYEELLKKDKKESVRQL